MDGDAAAFDELREKFVRNSARRLDDLAHALDLISAEPEDASTLDEAMRKFHGLAGLGTTFGFPEVTKIARGTEIECQQMLENKQIPDSAAIVRWRNSVEELRRQFASGGDAPDWRQTTVSSSAPMLIDVILLEDDPIGHRIAMKVLEKQGMSVRSAYTKSDALRLLDEKLPDALISDILVPDGSGYEVVEYLRSLPGGNVPPAIITSGLQGFLDKVEGVRCGADAFFEKPIDFAALVRTLENMLERVEGEAQRVLYIVNDVHDTSMVESVLESAGYQVRIATDPRHFDADLATFNPDLIIVTTDLPGVSGYELARYARQKRGFATTPVIVLSCDDSPQARAESVRAGITDHLAEPVNPGLLLATVASRIERARYLRNLMEHDGLTGLLNHSAFMAQVRKAWEERVSGSARPAVLIMLDIDRFKQVNDAYGHPAGDVVLASLGSILRKRLRQADAVARYGGEEFTVILSGLSVEESARLIDSVRKEFATVEHRVQSGAPLRVTFSAGVAAASGNVESIEQWKIAADQALYTAKREGRNRVVAATA